MLNQKEYNKCAEFEIILGVISMIVMVINDYEYPYNHVNKEMI